MVETIPIGAKNIEFDFLLHRDHHYELITRPESDVELLPSISSEWEGHLVLKNISYILVRDRCYVYDKNSYQSNKKYFPVYEECDGTYKYSGKTRIKKIPTKESVEAAKVIFAEFMEYITELEIKEKLQKIIGTEIMVFVKKPTEMQFKEYNLQKKYRIFVYEIGEHGYILVNCKRIAKIKRREEQVNANLRVPSSCLGAVIGKNAKSINTLKRLVGVEKINVLPID